MKIQRIVDVIAYLLWLASIVLYNLALWGPSPVSIDGAYVIRFSVNGTQPTQLDVGYFGVCAHISNSTQGSQADKYCVNDFDFTIEDKDKLYEEFIDDTDMPDGGSDSVLPDLLKIAGAFRTSSFPRGDAVAAMVLILLGGLVVIIPIFFNSKRRLKICGVLLAVSALLLGFGLMAGGGTFFSTWRTRKFVEAFPGFSDGNVGVEFGDKLWVFISAALALNCVFVALITFSAVVRFNAAPSSDGARPPQKANGFKPLRWNLGGLPKKTPKFKAGRRH